MVIINNKVINYRRYAFLMSVLSIVFCVFITKLADFQIINGNYYKARANSTGTYFVKSDPVRGEIVDNKGVGLAVNDTGYKIVLDRLLIEKSKENNVIINAVKLLDQLHVAWIDVLPISINNGEFSFKEDSESAARILKNTLGIHEDASAWECMSRMISKYKINDNLPLDEKRIICSIKYNMERSGVYYSRSLPYVLADKADKDSVIILLEKSNELQGIRVQSCLMRKYINGDIAPHLVGYTGFMSAEEYEKRKDIYAMDALIGKSGTEAVFEEFLRGVGGKRMMQVSKDGTVMDASERETAVSGNTVFLTISSKLQEVANKSLQKNIEQAKRSGAQDCESGGVVVLNVSDFSVLAASSYPGYNLASFTEDKNYYQELISDKRRPLLNRAFSGAYAPGSIYKPLVACAALQEGLVSPEEPIFCGGSFNYYHGYKLKCMGVHSNVTLTDALAKSCNVYFAELGRRLGADVLSVWAKKFGIGVKTGVEVGESEGVLAGPEHCKKVKSKWYESGSSQAAIGQSDNMFTPLQLASYVATLANGGSRYKTHIVSKITNYERSETIREFGPELVEKVDISQENLNTVKEGMRKVVSLGTARDFANYPIAIGAKTGTAQNSGSDHTTFVCFAPYENPQIAIAVVIAHGKTGTASKSVARDIMDEYFGLLNNKN